MSGRVRARPLAGLIQEVPSGRQPIPISRPPGVILFASFPGAGFGGGKPPYLNFASYPEYSRHAGQIQEENGHVSNFTKTSLVAERGEPEPLQVSYFIHQSALHLGPERPRVQYVPNCKASGKKKKNL